MTRWLARPLTETEKETALEEAISELRDYSGILPGHETMMDAMDIWCPSSWIHRRTGWSHWRLALERRPLTSELNTRYRMSIRSVNCAALVALGDDCC